MENTETRPNGPPQPAPPPPPVREPLPPRGTVYAAPDQKSPILAAFLSVLPGLGNVYNGLYRRAVVFFLIYVSLFALAINTSDRAKVFVIPCLVFIWFFNIFDAYRQATLINYYGEPPASDEGFGNMRGWGLALGVFLLALGAFGILQRYYNIDLSWVIDQWPYVLIVAGAWFIYRHFWERKEGDGAV